MILEYLTIALIALLSMIVSGNNLSAAVGTVVGSRIVSRQFGLLLGAGGFSLGLIIEGRFLSDSIFRIMPDVSYYVVVVLLISFVLFALATYFRIPLSLTMAIVGISLGVSLRARFTPDMPYVYLVIAAWVLAPFLSIISSFYLNRKVTAVKINDVWEAARIYKILLVLISFLTAFTLGANTFGLLAAMGHDSMEIITVMIIAIFAGAIFLSGGVIRRVSQDIFGMRYANAFVSLLVSSVLVEGATFFSLPLSNTQTLTSSVFGSGLSYNTKAMMSKPFLQVVAMWIISPLFGMLLGFLIA
ncbi:MAG: anion permease [Candidatus Thermoplasmatota archaeon]|jgi:PiT family inorganic phosphate transporter|nr:anion permease [Candidatus Thermoplasmatota archaeon]